MLSNIKIYPKTITFLVHVGDFRGGITPQNHLPVNKNDIIYLLQGELFLGKMY
jgi:hypothetical protein